jgi:hypothetical protein
MRGSHYVVTYDDDGEEVVIPESEMEEMLKNRVQ